MPSEEALRDQGWWGAIVGVVTFSRAERKPWRATVRESRWGQQTKHYPLALVVRKRCTLLSVVKAGWNPHGCTPEKLKEPTQEALKLALEQLGDETTPTAEQPTVQPAVQPTEPTAEPSTEPRTGPPVEQPTEQPTEPPPPPGVIHPAQCVRDGLESKPSTIEGGGNGLFTSVTLNKYTCLGVYTGNHCLQSARGIRNHRHQLAGSPCGYVIVQADTRVDRLAFVNEPPEGETVCTAALASCTSFPHIWLCCPGGRLTSGWSMAGSRLSSLTFGWSVMMCTSQYL